MTVSARSRSRSRLEPPATRPAPHGPESASDTEEEQRQRQTGEPRHDDRGGSDAAVASPGVSSKPRRRSPTSMETTNRRVSSAHDSDGCPLKARGRGSSRLAPNAAETAHGKKSQFSRMQRRKAREGHSGRTEQNDGGEPVRHRHLGRRPRNSHAPATAPQAAPTARIVESTTCSCWSQTKRALRPAAAAAGAPTSRIAERNPATAELRPMRYHCSTTANPAAAPMESVTPSSPNAHRGSHRADPHHCREARRMSRRLARRRSMRHAHPDE